MVKGSLLWQIFGVELQTYMVNFLILIGLSRMIIFLPMDAQDL